MSLPIPKHGACLICRLAMLAHWDATGRFNGCQFASQRQQVLESLTGGPQALEMSAHESAGGLQLSLQHQRIGR